MKNIGIMKFEFDSYNLSKEIRTKRIVELNIKQEEAAEAIGISMHSFRNMELDARTDVWMDNLIKVCNWLQKPPTEFFTVKS